MRAASSTRSGAGSRTPATAGTTGPESAWARFPRTTTTPASSWRCRRRGSRTRFASTWRPATAACCRNALRHWPRSCRPPCRRSASAAFPGEPGVHAPESRSGVGAGRRRRVLQGSDHRPRHQRRAARRRVPGARRGAGTDRALAGYQSTRDELSQELFEITDAIAGFEWDLDALKPLHLSLSKAMNHEVEALLGLDSPRCPPSRAGDPPGCRLKLL